MDIYSASSLAASEPHGLIIKSPSNTGQAKLADTTTVFAPRTKPSETSAVLVSYEIEHHSYDTTEAILASIGIPRTVSARNT